MERNIRIGTVGLPPRIDRERYFRELSYLELTATMSRAALARWRGVVPVGGLGLRADLDAPLPARDEIASCVIFHSPELFSPSVDHRERMRRFFGEVATADAVGAARVWLPAGLWEPLAAIRFASELGIVCAFDPLVRAPGAPLEIYYDLEIDQLYLRIERAGALRAERLDDLAALVEHYESLPTTLAFASTDRWRDARNVKKLVLA